MTKKETAAYLEITERTLERWTGQSKIGVRYERGKNGDVAVYDRGEVERFKAELERPTHRPAVQRMEPRMDGRTAPPTSGDTPDTGNFHPLSMVAPALPDAAQLDALARLLAAIGVAVTPDGQPRPLAAPQGNETAARPSVQDTAAKLLLTLAECQQLTGLPRTTLRAAIAAGDLKARQMGKAWRIKRADLDKWVSKL